jgi:DnaK suppressor protein
MIARLRVIKDGFPGLCEAFGLRDPDADGWRYSVVVSATTMRETDGFGGGEMAAAQEGEADSLAVMASGNDLKLPENYRPSSDEEFMNPRQLAYFRRKLIDWKESILRESAGTLETLKAEPMREPDVNDRASSETDWGIELRTRDRQRKVISKIDAALRRIETGDYGYCEVTGEPISLARLEARPIATMTLEAQERHERDEKITRDE